MRTRSIFSAALMIVVLLAAAGALASPDGDSLVRVPLDTSTNWPRGSRLVIVSSTADALASTLAQRLHIANQLLSKQAPDET